MKKSIVLALLLPLISCTTAPVKSIQIDQVETTRIFETNYYLNELKSVAVGNQIVKVKDYFISKRKMPYMAADRQFNITGLLINVDVHTAKNYKIVGITEINGIEYKLVEVARLNQQVPVAVGVDPKGNIFKEIFLKNALNVWVRNKPSSMNSDSVLMSEVTETKVDISRGYENYELLYNGTDGKSVFISYREFASNDLARVAFFQNLTYALTDTNIRFKNIKIKVNHADSQTISYQVVEDGLMSQ